MPVLDWIGKDKVVNHHLDVPYHVLERKYSFDESGMHDKDNGSDNMIIHGDNLLALKSLLPQYENGIDCIYIDPPYNTGNENWVYNDNVNDPRIMKWLGQVVGAEGEDLSRHDKWLCMMYPRLKLLQRLLSPKGVIFISIDDNEQATLKMLCNEIFGLDCFVANISWQRTYSPRNDSKGISAETEYILVYSKNPGWNPQKLPRTDKMNSVYKNPDNDYTLWRTSDAFAPSAATHQGMVYAIQHPITGEYIYPYKGACWPLEQSSMFEQVSEWADYEYKDLNDDEQRAAVCGVPVETIRKGVKAIVLAEPIESSREKGLAIIKRGQWPKFFFTKGGYGGIARKTYLDDSKGKVVTNFWPFAEAGHTDGAKKELKNIFDDKVFDTPKPSTLIERIIRISTGDDSVVLDSFAGSGTTAHAVLNLNKAGGNRKFILVELGDYADSTTAERVKRVIAGYSKDEELVLYDEEITAKNLSKGAEIIEKAKQTAKEAKDSGEYSSVKQPKIEDGHLRVIAIKKAKDQEPGIPGNFSYYELGEQLLKDGLLNDSVGIERIREYVFFTETKQKISCSKDDEPFFLGQHAGNAYYFYYEKDGLTTLDREFLHTVKTKSSGYVIYADLCTLSESELERYHITFKKIPRDISRL
ncbi:MAG: site-specific DNA-methyltransferase [Lachnospiraceae bacterium]|nr:site-specific DNA-methyltransferase [Lachnospiraceae bacterium]